MEYSILVYENKFKFKNYSLLFPREIRPPPSELRNVTATVEHVILQCKK